MFRKLVSNLPFSPALVGQLGFYARRLKKEEATRQLGLVFTLLALVVQSFAVFSPPEPANAANPSDFIYGGITTKEQLLAAYDASARGNGDIKKIYDYAGVTREELAAMKPTTLNSKSRGTNANAWLSWGRAQRFGTAQGEVQHDANGSTIYSRPLWLFDSTSYTKKNGSNYPALTGYSAKLGEFAILNNCANLVTTKLPLPTPPPTPTPVAVPTPEPKPVPIPLPKPAPTPKPVLPVSLPKIVYNKEAVNLTQGTINAETAIAKASDRIEYRLTIQNDGGTPVTTPLKEELSDVLEYSTIQDNGGANYDSKTKVLSWGDVNLKPGEKKVRTFVILLANEIPATPRGQSDPTSYDCIMTNAFGNTVNVNVDCSAPKVVESVVSELPRTGPGENMLFAGVLGSVVTYFYARSRQIGKEVRLIRKDFNMGTL